MEKTVENSKMTFGILFYIKKGRLKKNGLVPIMARITVNGEQAAFSSQIDVDPKHWNVKLNRLDLSTLARAAKLKITINFITMEQGEIEIKYNEQGRPYNIVATFENGEIWLTTSEVHAKTVARQYYKCRNIAKHRHLGYSVGTNFRSGVVD